MHTIKPANGHGLENGEKQQAGSTAGVVVIDLKHIETTLHPQEGWGDNRVGGVGGGVTQIADRNGIILWGKKKKQTCGAHDLTYIHQLTGVTMTSPSRKQTMQMKSSSSSLR